MPPPNVLPSEGTKLSIKIGSVMTEIGLVVEFDGLEAKRAPVETTSLTSLTHTRRPSNLPDPGTIKGKMWFDPNDTSTQKLIADRLNIPGPGEIDDFEVQFVDDNTTHAKATFSGFFTNFKGVDSAKIEENNAASFEIQMTTAVTYTAGTSSLEFRREDESNP